jgi:hypothetical protein
VEKLKSDRARWRTLPLAADVLGLVQTALKAEDRKDFPEKVAGLRLRKADGRLVRAQNVDSDPAKVHGLGYGPHTLRQLVAQIDSLDDAPRGFSSALLYLNDQERAELLNSRMAKMADRSTGVTLRTRLPHYSDGSRIARAALSDIYGDVTDFHLAEALGLMAQGDKHGRLDYKPGDTMSRFEVIWPSEVPVSTFVVGDVHYVVLSVTNSETGQGKIKIRAAILRAACANLTLSQGDGTSIDIRHVGDHHVLMARVRQALKLALTEVRPLIDVITQSAQIPVMGEWTAVKAFASIAKRYALPQGDAQAWTETFQRVRYPQTVWGLTASITEAAQARETWTDSAEWERVASDVQHAAVKASKGGAADPLAKALAA